MPKETKPNQKLKDDSRENNTLETLPPFGVASRHNARRFALQAMYQWQLSGTKVNDVEKEFLLYRINKKLDLAYFKDLIYGITSNLKEIENIFNPFLGRLLVEVDPVELSALRLATYELMHRPDVPYRVIINEALELTKKFGSVEGYKFVNGILDKVAKKIRYRESK